MAAQLHLHPGRSVPRAPSLHKPAFSLPKSRGEDDRGRALVSLNWSSCVDPWGASRASRAAPRAFAEQGLLSQPQQQSGTDGRSSAAPVASAWPSPCSVQNR
ncbi:hypothetical protein EK904_008534 [Melospiza melodia maxima]|nr:hypothetical protein EK904_008534 [Melospiza melodia maxima]